MSAGGPGEEMKNSYEVLGDQRNRGKEWQWHRRKIEQTETHKTPVIYKQVQNMEEEL